MLQPRGVKTAKSLRREELLALAERFASHVHPEPNTGCFYWDGATTVTGYGQLWLREGRKRHPLLAHRVAYALEHGELAAGADLLHRCDNPLCCNPAHLRQGSATENNRDMDVRSRRACGDRHHNAGRRVEPKLNREAVVEIRRRLATGERVCDLARTFAITERNLQRIKRGEIWKGATR
jgi:hypothetical protein